jgi:apolipoprotein N-acyltransferase
VLFNTANYGWFGPTAFRAQIRAVTALRAAELGQTVVMAGNTGPTAFFDPVGAVYGDFQPQALDAEGHLPAEGVGGPPPAPPGPPASDATTFQTGFTLDHLYADDTFTLYAEWGDFPWYSLAGLLLLGTLLASRRRREPPTTTSAALPTQEGIR